MSLVLTPQFNGRQGTVKAKKAGFSLVELSIVLVIFGLLIGGIFKGQSLIRASKLQNVTTEFQVFQTATITFRDKYFALPGDMKNATDFWGAAGCTGTAGTGTETCNGNGDGRVRRTIFTAGHYNEQFLFWQHLANAGLIEGSYTGMAGPLDSNHKIAQENVPISKLGNSWWQVGNWTTPAGHGSVLGPLDLGNYFAFEKVREPGGDYRALTPEEAWNIDKKIDDGKAGRGTVIGIGWNNECMDGSASDDYDLNYNLDDSSLQCALYFIRLF